MGAHEIAFFFKREGRGDLAGGEVGPDVAEDPGSAECAAADHDAGAFCLFEHALGVLWSADVAVADDGDSLDGGDDGGDAVEAGLAGEAHLGGSAVNGDQLDADLLEAGSEIGGDD